MEAYCVPPTVESMLEKRQSRTSLVLSNLNAVAGRSGSAGGADDIELRENAILGAFLLSPPPFAPNDVSAITGTSGTVAASPVPAWSAVTFLVPEEPCFQAAAITDTSNVSTDAPLALIQQAFDASALSETNADIKVGVLPDGFSNLHGASQAVADGDLPPISDIPVLNQLSSGGTDEVQIVQDVASGGGLAFYTADYGEQYFAKGIVAANAANSQDAVSDAISVSPTSITGFSASNDLTITTAGMASVVLPGYLAPGTAIAIPSSYSWQGFAESASQNSVSQSSAGSVVAETAGGITIDLLFDAAAMAAPASFRTGIEQAATILGAAISDKITVNINIDYSGTGGGASAGPDGGSYETYSSIRGDLINGATPGDTTFNALPSGQSIQGQSLVAVWNAQLKLFGLLAPNSTTTDDGSATFATDIQSNLLVGVALHELTHAMGRVPYGPEPDIFDFFRFTSVGNHLFSSSIPAPAAYFSVDGGNTNLAFYGLDSDPSDFLNVQPNSNDPFDEYYSSNTIQTLTPLDLEQLDALGFHLTPLTVSVAAFIADQSILNIISGFTILDTAANVQANLAALTADAGHITSITATGGPVTVGNGLFVPDEAALNEIVGGFNIGGQAGVLSGNLNGLESDISHINSITGLNGTITSSVAQFLIDETALNEVVGGFAISDTAANVQADLAALTADVSHIASITATGGPVTVGNGLFVPDEAALNDIVGGFNIGGQAPVLSGNLNGLESDISHINSIAGLNGTITASVAEFLSDQPGLDKIIGGYDVDLTNNGATNISSVAISYSGTVGLIFDGTTAQNITMTTQEYNDFSTITDGASTAAANSTVTFTDSGTVVTNSNVGNYDLAATGGDAITIGTAGTVALGSHAGADTITFGAATSSAEVTGWVYTSDILKVSAIGTGVVAATSADLTFSASDADALSMGHVNFVTDSTNAGNEVAFYTHLSNYSAGNGRLDTGAAAGNTILIVNDGTHAVDGLFYVVGNGAHGATSVALVGTYDLATAHFAATLLA
jgi:hypothetical protein